MKQKIQSLQRLAQSSPVFTHRSGPAHVLPRRAVAQSGPHLDHPHRRHGIDERSTNAAWPWKLPDTNSGAPTARRSGTTCKRREARISGSPVTTSRPAKGRGIISSATNGRCISMCRPTENFFAVTAATTDMVAHAENGKWIYLFPPEFVPDTSRYATLTQTI